jgi:hypothetical protein
MTMFEIFLAGFAVALTSFAMAYTLHLVRRIPTLERPEEARVRRMIETAPRGKFDNALAR